MTEATERLLVLSPFEGYEFGERITAQAAMKRALRDHPDFVLRETVPAPVDEQDPGLDSAEPDAAAPETPDQAAETEAPKARKGR